MKKNTARLILIATLFVIILNGALLTILWSNQSEEKQKKPPFTEINDFIIREMSFDENKASKFREIAANHFENQTEHQIRYREIKHKLTRAMIDGRDQEVNTLLDDLILVVQAKELELYRFFKEVKLISTEEQHRKFGRIFREATGAPDYERIPMSNESKRPPHPKH